MYARKEYDTLEKNLGIFELIINSIVSVLHSTTLVMIVPFVMLYTKGVYDVNYSRPTFAIVAVIASAFDCFRMPYKTIVTAIGHFKQTRNGAIFEAVLNIVISSVCVVKFGLIGVAIGTLCAMVFRTFQYAIYLSKNVMDRKLSYFVKHIGLSLLTILMVSLISKLYLYEVNSWLKWIVFSILTVLISSSITLAIDLLFYKDDLVSLIKKILNKIIL